jgi:hypothetical protein
MVYGPRLDRDGWLSVLRRLARRAFTLYACFIAVTLSILAISLAGIDVSSVTTWDPGAMSWFLDPRTMSAANWRDIALIHYGPWAFEIVGLYVWLVLAAGPCLIALRVAGWQALLGVSWFVYLGYRITPHQLTAAEFELVFPLLSWQLLFVHGIAIGYHREGIGAFLARAPKALPLVVAGGSVAFMIFALSNPAVAGPSWLRWAMVSPQHFASMYERYFSLSDLGMGRVLNLAVALPAGYALLTHGWPIARRFQALFVTLGQGSLGAFVLHVYGLLLLAHLPITDEVWINTVVQLLLIVAIAWLLNGMERWRVRRVRPFAAPGLVPIPAR